MNRGDKTEENKVRHDHFIPVIDNVDVKEEEKANNSLIDSNQPTVEIPSSGGIHPFTRQCTCSEETVLRFNKSPKNVPLYKSKPAPRCFNQSDHCNLNRPQSPYETEPVKSIEARKAESMNNISRDGVGQMSQMFLESTSRPDINTDIRRNDSFIEDEELEVTIETSLINQTQNDDASNICDCVSNNEIYPDESDKMSQHSDEKKKMISVRKKRTVNTLDSTPLSMAHSCTSKHIINSKKDKLKIQSLIKLIDKDREAADMKLSLFMSASSKDPTSLHPFPNSYFEDTKANRHLVYLISEEIPSIDMFLFLLREKADEVEKDTVAFIEWLIKSEDPRLESVDAVEGKGIMEAISHVPPDKMPPKIFRIKNKRNGEKEVLWDQVKRDNPTKYAYHQCKVEEAHTVLHYGLHKHLDKHGTFGAGIYLTNDLSRCLELSTPGLTWGKSILASKIKLIFISEFVCNHNVIEYDQTNETSQSPLKNYFLKKPVLVKLRYLLVYVTEPSTLPKTPFVFSPMRTKMLKYLNVVRCALLVITVLVGMAARRKAKSPTDWMIENAQHYFRKVSNNINQWTIWNHIEPTFFNIPSNEPNLQLTVN